MPVKFLHIAFCAMQTWFSNGKCKKNTEQGNNKIKKNRRKNKTALSSDVNSEMPLLPSHLLTMKTDVILLPLGVFLKSDIYSRRR